jgi:hypothetical protein
MQAATKPSQDKVGFNFFKICGNNSYGSLGIGLTEA